VQIFATDIDSNAIATARAGIYPASIAADLSPERLARFFIAEPGGNAYRIHKGIRDMLVFSEHSLIKDPPFSKLDLISCRNLLIYLDGDLQKKLIPMFHYALNSGGYLFLGNSETVGEFLDLFVPRDRKQKLYQRREDIHRNSRPDLGKFVAPITAIPAAIPRSAGQAAPRMKPPLRQLAEQALLQQVALAGALVNENGNILYFYGRTGLYLEPTPGETGACNILEMAREGLRQELTTALHKAKGTKDVVRHPGLRVKTNGDYTLLNLTVRPVVTASTAMSETLYMVILEDAPPFSSEQAPSTAPQTGAGVTGPDSDSAAHIMALQQELKAKEEYIQSAREEQETSNEELRSSYEEMQSVNEELQSTNEELETSKEELQSVNEELATVNNELQTKVADLSKANNDMNNLLAGTGIATIFVDHQLRLLRFTPFATKIINLILSDIGRPVGHIVSNLVGYDHLVSDVQEVLKSLIPQEMEVQTKAGDCYTMRIQPYRTIDNVIEGAVITFVDITEMKQIREQLRQANDLLRLAVVVRDAHDAVSVQDMGGNILAWNPAAERMYGWSEAEALAMNIHDLIPANQQAEALLMMQQLARAEVLAPYRAQRQAKDGRLVNIWLTATALVNKTGKIYAIATTERARGGAEQPSEVGEAKKHNRKGGDHD
jgi:two-component system CheB/CheR fusion protein